ncbi:MAG: ribosome maturation factor RimP, partial [Ruthenibacterium sp.]
MAKQQAAGKATGTVQKVEALVEPILAELDLRLWDVRFEKEGPDWFLRVWIDRDTPLDIQTCEDATRAINPVLDAADPITQSYFLEVGSPGLGRRLTKDAHFTAVQGKKILAHLYRVTAAGEKDISGILISKDGNAVTLRRAEDTQIVLDTKEVSYFKLCDD